eukprot:CAMPEP_0168534178 /NCGR_PEP_ID=MMETSP0405-20121227/17683_1 /TAXON_ID=498012 /ORGANISM="Trichosphaerium sp, Strain Am-I-7 wt" /LENGTH=676 /DNA_ID=CAMNT_0008560711 /DNA_START=477 /DNA_END=2504 /DNA_ORIENTATION=+
MSKPRVNGKKGYRFPPIHRAARLGQLDKLHLLLDQNPDSLYTTDAKSRSTPLHLAIKYSQLEASKLLIERGADVNARDAQGKSPIHWAATRTTKDYIELFIGDKRADLLSTDVKGRTVLHVAVLYGCVATITRLLDLLPSSSANLKTKETRTPLLLTIRYGKKEAEQALLQSDKVNVDIVDKKKRSPLHHAAKAGLVDTLNRLLARNPNLELRDMHGRTALHYAAELGSSPCTLALLRAKARVDAIDNVGHTALHLAAQRGHDAVCHSLESNGADVSARYDPQILAERKKAALDKRRMMRDRMDEVSESERSGEDQSYLTTETVADDSIEIVSQLDRYGFVKKEGVNNDNPPGKRNGKDIKKQQKKEVKAADKWVKILKRLKDLKHADKIAKEIHKDDSIRDKIWRGIPLPVKGQAWRLLSGTNEMVQKYGSDLYEECLKAKGNTKVTNQIDLDIQRSARSHIQFRERYGQGQVSLFNVLKAYSVFDQDVAYCQGMADIVAFFLMHVDENAAFWLLISLCKNPKFEMDNRFVAGFPGLRKSFHVLKQVLTHWDASVMRHLEEVGITMSLFVVKWFLKVFLDCFQDVEVNMRLWDIFMWEGYDLLYSISLAIFRLNKHKLLESDLGGCMTLLSQPLVCNTEEFIKEVKICKVKSSHLRKYEREYRAVQDAELMKGQS